MIDNSNADVKTAVWIQEEKIWKEKLEKTLYAVWIQEEKLWNQKLEKTLFELK